MWLTLFKCNVVKIIRLHWYTMLCSVYCLLVYCLVGFPGRLERYSAVSLAKYWDQVADGNCVCFVGCDGSSKTIQAKPPKIQRWERSLGERVGSIIIINSAVFMKMEWISCGSHEVWAFLVKWNQGISPNQCTRLLWIWPNRLWRCFHGQFFVWFVSQICHWIILPIVAMVYIYTFVSTKSGQHMDWSSDYIRLCHCYICNVYRPQLVAKVIDMP